MSDKTQERWPFDPLQPGDHEPARLPEELERVRKRTGRPSPQGDEHKPEERRK